MSTSQARTAEVANAKMKNFRRERQKFVIPDGILPSGHARSAIQDYLKGESEIRYKTMTSPFSIVDGRLMRVGKITRWWSIRDEGSGQELLSWLKRSKEGDVRSILVMTELELRRAVKEKRFGFAIQVRRIVDQVLATTLPNGMVLGNSSGLGMQRRKNLDDDANTRQLEAQRFLALCGVPMLPFQLFETLNADIETLQVIDQGPEETFRIQSAITKANPQGLRHFSGATLFLIAGNYYLFDCDRGDLSEGVFNPFLSKLPHQVRTIGEAYRSLKPAEVAAAELCGKSVVRQGEWFFIPVDGEHQPMLDAVGRLKEAELQSKGNRPHWVTKLSSNGLVSGKVRHGGYEHPPVELKGWYKPVPNTAIESWTIEGRVD